MANSQTHDAVRAAERRRKLVTGVFIGIAALQLIVAVSGYFRVLGTRSEQSVAIYAFETSRDAAASDVLRVTFDHTAREVIEPEALDVISDDIVAERTLDLQSGPVEILRFDGDSPEHDVTIVDGPRRLSADLTVPTDDGAAMAMDVLEQEGPTVFMMDGTSRFEGVSVHERERCADETLELFVVPDGGAMRRLELHALNFLLFSNQEPAADRRLELRWHDTFGEHSAVARTDSTGLVRHPLEAAAFVSMNVSTTCAEDSERTSDVEAAWTADIVSHSVTTDAEPELWIANGGTILNVDVSNPYVSGAVWWHLRCEDGQQSLGGENTARGDARIEVLLPESVAAADVGDPAACELSIFRGGDYTSPPMATVLVWVSAARGAMASDALGVASGRLQTACVDLDAHCEVAGFVELLATAHAEGTLTGSEALSRMSDAYPFRRHPPQQILSTRAELELLATERRSAQLRAYHLFFSIELLFVIVAIVAFVVARSRQDSVLEAELEAEFEASEALELTDQRRVFWYWVQAIAVLGLALLGAMFLAWLGIGDGL